jgi:hypothetical protein
MDIEMLEIFRIASMTGMVRFISSSRDTATAPGRVDSPPISIISAPLFSIYCTWDNALPS